MPEWICYIFNLIDQVKIGLEVANFKRLGGSKLIKAEAYGRVHIISFRVVIFLVHIARL